MVVSGLGRNGHCMTRSLLPRRWAELRTNRTRCYYPLLSWATHITCGGVESVQTPCGWPTVSFIYDHPELMVNWYPTCGNHEYRGATLRRLSSTIRHIRRWEDACEILRQDLWRWAELAQLSEVIFLETTPLIDKYRGKKDRHISRDAVIRIPLSVLQWLEKTLTGGDGRLDRCGRSSSHLLIPISRNLSEPERAEESRYNLMQAQMQMYTPASCIHNYQHIRRPDSKNRLCGQYIRLPSRVKSAKFDGTVFCNDSPGFSVPTADKK